MTGYFKLSAPYAKYHKNASFVFIREISWQNQISILEKQKIA
jgi:hypothetical protein